MCMGCHYIFKTFVVEQQKIARQERLEEREALKAKEEREALKAK